MALALTVLIVFAILIVNEWWWRTRTVHSEFSRKFAHITIGSFVAFWPFFLSWDEIIGLSLAFLLVVAASKYLKVFRAIHTAQRPTWGEVFFALSVGLIAFITHDKWIYAAALLQMALADGLAAIVGVQYGNRLKYLIYGHTKSWAGTLCFFVVSLAILAGLKYWAGMPLELGHVVLISALATVVENVAVFGLDNLLVPVLVALLLVNR